MNFPFGNTPFRFMKFPMAYKHPYRPTSPCFKKCSIFRGYNKGQTVTLFRYQSYLLGSILEGLEVYLILNSNYKYIFFIKFPLEVFYVSLSKAKFRIAPQLRDMARENLGGKQKVWGTAKNLIFKKLKIISSVHGFYLQ